MKISVSLDYEQYSNLCVETNKDDTVRMEGDIKTEISAIPDTGPSVDCTGAEILRRGGNC